MIHQYRGMKAYRAECHFMGHTVCAVAPTPHEAWQWLIEFIAVEAKP